MNIVSPFNGSILKSDINNQIYKNSKMQATFSDVSDVNLVSPVN
ncbi:2_t:CDS:1, partial [Gigaspora rosea]